MPSTPSSVAAEAEALAWIEEVTGRKRDGAPIEEWLHDGTILCELINAIKPGSIRKILTSPMPFKQMENINAYTQACTKIGVPQQDSFVTVDLYEGKNLPAVVRNLHSLGRVAQSTAGFSGPSLGAKLSTRNERSFSVSQLAAAKATPSRWTAPRDAKGTSADDAFLPTPDVPAPTTPSTAGPNGARRPSSGGGLHSRASAASEAASRTSAAAATEAQEVLRRTSLAAETGVGRAVGAHRRARARESALEHERGRVRERIERQNFTGLPLLGRGALSLGGGARERGAEQHERAAAHLVGREHLAEDQRGDRGVGDGL
jgi:hypothetical protein